jgi:hypothetical protein
VREKDQSRYPSARLVTSIMCPSHIDPSSFHHPRHWLISCGALYLTCAYMADGEWSTDADGKKLRRKGEMGKCGDSWSSPRLLITLSSNPVILVDTVTAETFEKVLRLGTCAESDGDREKVWHSRRSMFSIFAGAPLIQVAQSCGSEC